MPIICIANDGKKQSMKSLVNYCFEIHVTKCVVINYMFAFIFQLLAFFQDMMFDCKFIHEIYSSVIVGIWTSLWRHVFAISRSPKGCKSNRTRWKASVH